MAVENSTGPADNMVPLGRNDTVGGIRYHRRLCAVPLILTNGSPPFIRRTLLLSGQTLAVSGFRGRAHTEIAFPTLPLSESHI